MELNAEQIRVVEAPLRQHIVVDGAQGAGKTTTLVHRMVHLINSMGIEPKKIILCTFTNSQAQHIRGCLCKVVGTEIGKAVKIGTFHSLCCHILRQYGHHIGLPTKFNVISREDSRAWLKQIINEIDGTRLAVDYGEQDIPQIISETISLSKHNLQTPDTFEADVVNTEKNATKRSSLKVIHSIYSEYERVKRSSESLDFDDLLVQTLHLFNLQPKLCTSYAANIKMMIIDNFHEIGMLQYELTLRLTGADRSKGETGVVPLTIAGDSTVNNFFISKFLAFFGTAVYIQLPNSFQNGSRTSSLGDSDNTVKQQQQPQQPQQQQQQGIQRTQSTFSPRSSNASPVSVTFSAGTQSDFDVHPGSSAASTSTRASPVVSPSPSRDMTATPTSPPAKNEATIKDIEAQVVGLLNPLKEGFVLWKDTQNTHLTLPKSSPYSELLSYVPEPATESDSVSPETEPDNKQCALLRLYTKIFDNIIAGYLSETDTVPFIALPIRDLPKSQSYAPCRFHANSRDSTSIEAVLPLPNKKHFHHQHLTKSSSSSVVLTENMSSSGAGAGKGPTASGLPSIVYELVLGSSMERDEWLEAIQRARVEDPTASQHYSISPIYLTALPFLPSNDSDEVQRVIRSANEQLHALIKRSEASAEATLLDAITHHATDTAQYEAQLLKSISIASQAATTASTDVGPQADALRLPLSEAAVKKILNNLDSKSLTDYQPFHYLIERSQMDPVNTQSQSDVRIDALNSLRKTLLSNLSLLINSTNRQQNTATPDATPVIQHAPEEPVPATTEHSSATVATASQQAAEDSQKSQPKTPFQDKFQQLEEQYLQRGRSRASSFETTQPTQYNTQPAQQEQTAKQTQPQSQQLLPPVPKEPTSDIRSPQSTDGLIEMYRNIEEKLKAISRIDESQSRRASVGDVTVAAAVPHTSTVPDDWPSNIYDTPTH